MSKQNFTIVDDTTAKIRKEQEEKTNNAPKPKKKKEFNDIKEDEFPQLLDKIEFADGKIVMIGTKVRSLFWRDGNDALEYKDSPLDFTKAVEVEKIEAVSPDCVLYYFKGDTQFYQARHFKRVK